MEKCFATWISRRPPRSAGPGGPTSRRSAGCPRVGLAAGRSVAAAGHGSAFPYPVVRCSCAGLLPANRLWRGDSQRHRVLLRCAPVSELADARVAGRPLVAAAGLVRHLRVVLALRRRGRACRCGTVDLADWLVCLWPGVDGGAACAPEGAAAPAAFARHGS